MEAGEIITMADVKAALDAQGQSGYKMMPGDAILFHTGWDQYWTDPAHYNAGCPGIGIGSCALDCRWKRRSNRL